MSIPTVSWEFDAYTNFRQESGKLMIQIKDDYYINWKTGEIEKMFSYFP